MGGLTLDEHMMRRGLEIHAKANERERPTDAAKRLRRAIREKRAARPTKKPARPRFPVGHVVAEAAEPHSALEVVAVEDGLYTLRYKTHDAWRGHEITRGAADLVPFGFLPKRAKQNMNYREA